MRHRCSIVINKNNELQDYIKVWILRILEPLGGHRNFIGKDGCRNDQLAEVLGFEQVCDKSTDEFNVSKARKALRKVYLAAENNMDKEVPDGVLKTNISRLGELAGLSDVDCKILTFAVQIHSEQLLEEAADLLNDLSLSKVQYVLSVILDIPEKDIRNSLSSSGILAQSGLLNIDKRSKSKLDYKLDLLSDSFADLVTTEEGDPMYLLREAVMVSTPPELCLDDYGYIKDSLDILRPYLKQAFKLRKKGVNVLIYGQPGTGKTQIVKALARDLECELFDVASEDLDGDSVDGVRRLRAYRATQSFFAQSKALIAFEEVEDVFGSDNRGSIFDYVGMSGRQKSERLPSKAWLNHMLETNKIPTVWLSNSIYSIDPAYIRRFDLVVEMPMPSKRQRENIIRESCGDMLTPQTVRQLSCEENLAPAVINRAASVVRCIKDELPEANASSSIEHIIESTLKAQGYIEALSNDSGRLPDYFDLDFTHADTDLVQIAEGLERSGSGRICLYGPPGTGKTAYGRWLADRLGIPLVLKRASDMLSPYIGVAEINIAKAFKEAARDKALLMIDEVDSFLQDRRDAVRSWEVSQVNEFLTQMENYPGIFIASTNLMDGLDQAALRRFDLKSKFDYMTHDQAWSMFRQHCDMLGISLVDNAIQARLSRLTVLTPGDFATVMRQHRFRPINSETAMIEALQSECAAKEQPPASVGFLAGRA